MQSSLARSSSYVRLHAAQLLVLLSSSAASSATQTGGKWQKRRKTQVYNSSLVRISRTLLFQLNLTKTKHRFHYQRKRAIDGATEIMNAFLWVGLSHMQLPPWLPGFYKPMKMLRSHNRFHFSLTSLRQGGLPLFTLNSGHRPEAQTLLAMRIKLRS